MSDETYEADMTVYEDDTSDYESLENTNGEYDSDDESTYHLTAQEQWDASVKEITQIFNLILFPLVGKVLGRKFGHIVWGRIADWWFV